MKVLSEADFLADLIRDKAIDNVLQWPYPTPFIKSVNSKGEVIVEFTRPIQLIDPKIDLTELEYEVRPDVWEPVLRLELDPYKTHDPEDLKFTWEITSYSKSQFNFQLYFEDPLMVSYDVSVRESNLS